MWPPPKYLSDPKVITMQRALCGRDPFYSGTCSIPDHHQRLLYYSHHDAPRRLDFSNAEAGDLEALYDACSPAEFGRNGENVFDESYRKARKMDIDSFATLFDPRDLGIHEEVSKALLTWTDATMDVELYKLNAYGVGDFFKAHKDTPRSQNMFGSLVVVLPTAHEGGQLVLRKGERDWTLDLASEFATVTEPSVCFVAFFGDVEHEVLPVSSGYRVTLTYNLYNKPVHPSLSSIPTPFYLRLKQVLIDLVNDESTLPNGGYLGFGLVHEYVHPRYSNLAPLTDALKGTDRALVAVCDELGLSHALKFFYRDVGQQYSWIDLLASEELYISDPNAPGYKESPEEYLREALEKLSIEDVEGVLLVQQHKFDPACLEPHHPFDSWLAPFYRDPITEVLEVTEMKSSLNVYAEFVAYGNEADLRYLYGTACLLIELDPAESRGVVG